jgi:tryptophan synthase alpha chain
VDFSVICYISLGYPSLEESLEIATTCVEGGAATLEIGWPTDNAFLDNDNISSRMKKSLEKCKDTESYFETILKMKQKNPSAKFIMLVYEHSVEEIGVDRFTQFCLENRINNIILVGNKDDQIKEELMEKGLKVSCYVPFHLPDKEVAEAKNSNGFVYLQSKSSGEEKEGYETLEKCIKFLREQGINQPVYCGVGIYNKEDVRRVYNEGADGAFIGSSLLKKQDNLEELKEFIEELVGEIQYT